MRYRALAADYDGTLAHDGQIDEDTWTSLRRLRAAGLALIMVTGRELDELLALLRYPELFDRIVAENGGLLYEPRTREIRMTSGRPPDDFVKALRRRGVERIAVGRTIVATWEPHEETVLQVIRELGLELQVIFNKGAVMVLPSGINKATGLAAALLELGLSRHNVVGVGDAENDHALLGHCECGVAVANALASLKHRADLVTEGHHGAGVRELIAHLLTDDLAIAAPKLSRHHVRIGTADDGEVAFDPYAANIMVCGTSARETATVSTGILERLAAGGYQFAVFDPEGQRAAVECAIILGDTTQPPLISETVDLLLHPAENIVADLLGVSLEHRPAYFAHVLTVLSGLQASTGRPHWLVIDHADHLIPASASTAAEIAPPARGMLCVTAHPRRVQAAVLSAINTLIIVGDHAEVTLAEFCEAAHIAPPPPVAGSSALSPGQALYWCVGSPRAVLVRPEPPRTECKRPSRKSLDVNLGRQRAFSFRGPDGKLDLAAPNVQMFLYLGDGVDDDTWEFHLRNGDYSRWFRTEVEDADLAQAIECIERNERLSPDRSRAAIRTAVERRYLVGDEGDRERINAPG
ncbi:MAG: HAD-IIB family hydrolase [Kofleriaceae bacterium]|nr:HAD-IIB family hydrolase [Kofleriaceae bacterium]